MSNFPFATKTEAQSADGDDTSKSPNPGDPPDFTSIPYHIIQINKELSSSTENADGTYTTVYTIVTSNLGNRDLFDTQVTDDLASAGFGTYNATASSSGDLLNSFSK